MDWVNEMEEMAKAIEGVSRLRQKLGVLCTAPGELGSCSSLIELMVDRSKPSRKVKTKEGHDWIYPTYRHKSGLCRYHRDGRA